MNQSEWMDYGIQNGYCGPIVCYTHDGLPTTIDEDEEFEEGEPCIHIIRPYIDISDKLAVEYNHSPSEWRKNG